MERQDEVRRKLAAMSPEYREAFERLIREQADEFGVTPEAYLAEMDYAPAFREDAAREAAATSGVTADDILAADVTWLREAPAPGPECLDPTEAVAYAEAGGLAPERMAHVHACTSCAGLLEAVAPSTAVRDRVIADVRAVLTLTIGAPQAVIEVPAFPERLIAEKRGRTVATGPAWVPGAPAFAASGPR